MTSSGLSVSGPDRGVIETSTETVSGAWLVSLFYGERDINSTLAAFRFYEAAPGFIHKLDLHLTLDLSGCLD